MRKKLTGILAAGAALAMMVSGTAMAMDAAELNQKTSEAFKDVQQYTVSFDGGAEAVMNVVQAGENGANMEFPLNGSVTGTAAVSLEPLAMSEQLTFSGSMMGQEMSGSVQAYLASQDDGSAVMYTKADFADAEGEWQASKVSAENIAEMKDAFYTLRDEGVDAFIDKYAEAEDNTLDKEQMKALAESLTAKVNENTQVNEGVYNEDSVLCDEAVCELSGDALTGIMTDFMTAANGAGAGVDDESLAAAGAVAGMLNVKITNCFEQETGLPVSGKIDLAGSDFPALAQMIGAMTGSEDAAFGISVSRLDLNYKTDCKSPVEVTVPEEALAAPVQEAEDPMEEIESVVDGLENETEGEEEDMGVINADGSYHLEETDFDGNKIAADVAVPEGMKASYATESSVYFLDESLQNTASYMTITYANADDQLKQELDTSYMESRSEYSDINVSEIGETVLENGNTVKYATLSYKYEEYSASRTYAVIPVGNMALEIQIEKMDEKFDPVEVTQEDVVRYAEAVTIAE